jgi:hypothetical protein
LFLLFCFGATAPSWPGPPLFSGFTLTLDRTPLDEWLPSQRALPNNTQHSWETGNHSPDGTRTRNPSKRASDRAATGAGLFVF